jgi:hypothetical protein
VQKETIIGFKEYVTVFGKNKQRKLLARIDTGASKNSIDSFIAREIGLGPVLRYKEVKSAHGIAKRGLIMARIEIAGRRFKAFFTIADRKHMKYPVLVGRNLLKQGFVIDPKKKPR